MKVKRLVSILLVFAVITSTLTSCKTTKKILVNNGTGDSSVTENTSSTSSVQNATGSSQLSSTAGTNSQGNASTNSAVGNSNYNNSNTTNISNANNSSRAVSSTTNNTQIVNFDFNGAGTTLLGLIKQNFWNSSTGTAKEVINKNQTAYLWPYTSLVEDAAANYKLNKSDANKAFYIAVLNGLEKYKASRTDYLVYNSAAGGEPFYDDNVWVAIEFYKASQLLNDSAYLDKSKKVVEYCYKSWDTKQGGGVYWKEYNSDTKNACINAPLAMISAELYLKTNNTTYKDWAIKIYNWTKLKLMDSKDGLYWDSINANTGSVNTTKWSYNTGCMISAGSFLYTITKNSSYLNDAKKSAASAYNGGFGRVASDYYLFSGATPWFDYHLMNGYIDLYNITKDPTYVGSFMKAGANAWKKARNSQGFVDKSWRTVDSGNEITLIDQNATAQIFLTLQDFKNKNHV